MSLNQWKSFIYFQEELKYKIRNDEITAFINECYLIDDKTYEKYFNNNIELNNTKNDNIDYNFYPEIIYDISSAIRTLENYKKLKLIRKDIMRSICDLNYLRYYKTINVYCGNNKLIIVFFENLESNALLIVNPIDSIIDNNMYSFIIAFRTLNYLKENIYISLLYNENINLNKNLVNILQNNNIIIFKNFDEYIKNINAIYPIKENGIPNNCFNFVIDVILKIFIYIFYYEKTLSISKENFFNENHNYFLINPDWLKTYKDFYDYNNLYKALDDYSNNKNNNRINYNNIENYISTISFNIKESFWKKRKSEIKIDIDNIMINPSKINNIIFYEDCFIIDEKIIDIINEYEYLNKKIQKTSDIIKISINNNYVFLIDTKLISISIGKINEKLLFIPLCLLAYKNKRIQDEEKHLLFSNTIIDYLRLRKCSETNKNMQTLIKDQENE